MPAGQTPGRATVRPSSPAQVKEAVLYGERAAPVYDQDAPPCDERMVDALATLAGSGRVLELGIGTGRVALPLAERGVRVQGIDISPAMVERLRAKPGGEAIEVAIGSFADLPAIGEFELIYVVYNTFYMLRTREEQLRCVRGVAEHLAPGGTFVVEGFVLDDRRVDPNMAGTHPDPAQLTLQYSGMGTHGPRTFPVALRVANPADLDGMARAAGLRRMARWAGWDATPYMRYARSHISFYTRPASRRRA